MRHSKPAVSLTVTVHANLFTHLPSTMTVHALSSVYKLQCFCNVLTRGAKGVVLHIPVHDTVVHASLCVFFLWGDKTNCLKATGFLCYLYLNTATDRMADNQADRQMTCQTGRFTMYSVCCKVRVEPNLYNFPLICVYKEEDKNCLTQGFCIAIQCCCGPFELKRKKKL